MYMPNMIFVKKYIDVFDGNKYVKRSTFNVKISEFEIVQNGMSLENYGKIHARTCY